MNYHVIATHWNPSTGEIEKHKVGRFTDFANALIFRDAYIDKFSGYVEIIGEAEFFKEDDLVD